MNQSFNHSTFIPLVKKLDLLKFLSADFVQVYHFSSFCRAVTINWKTINLISSITFDLSAALVVNVYIVLR